MPHVQVRDVPEDIHAELTRRAERAGMSLQKYLAGKLELIASTPSVDDVLETIEKRSKGKVDIHDAIAALSAERARR